MGPRFLRDPVFAKKGLSKPGPGNSDRCFRPRGTTLKASWAWAERPEKKNLPFEGRGNFDVVLKMLGKGSSPPVTLNLKPVFIERRVGGAVGFKPREAYFFPPRRNFSLTEPPGRPRPSFPSHQRAPRSYYFLIWALKGKAGGNISEGNVVRGDPADSERAA